MYSFVSFEMRDNGVWALETNNPYTIENVRYLGAPWFWGLLTPIQRRGYVLGLSVIAQQFVTVTKN